MTQELVFKLYTFWDELISLDFCKAQVQISIHLSQPSLKKRANNKFTGFDVSLFCYIIPNCGQLNYS